jgi:hypothetical protein
MQFKQTINNQFKKLPKMLPNKFSHIYLGVLFLLLFFQFGIVQHSSDNTRSFNNISCEIQSSHTQNQTDARQSNSTVSILQNLNFNRPFQLDLIFKFQLPGRFLIVLSTFWLFLYINKRNQVFKFFYQIHIKSSIPCRASPQNKRGELVLTFTQTTM